jgi:dihydrofolate reductase
VFIAVSLDGFIARRDGAIDWLELANQRTIDGEDYGYERFFSSIDALVLGRNAFDKVRTFDPWPYKDKRTVVLSRSMRALPEKTPPTVSVTDEAPAALLERLAREGVTHVYVDGGVTVQRFLAEGLIHELTVTTIPTLIGEGLPLFGPLARDVVLDLLESRAYPSGFVRSVYRPRG